MARDDLENGHAASSGSSRAPSSAIPLLSLRNVSKTFGQTTVLHGVDLDIDAGEIRGLVGENGSGKSTLIKILAGFHKPDPGAEVSIRGEAVPLPMDPVVSRELGLSFVHQDLALVPSLSVAENMTVGTLTDGRWTVGPRREVAATRAALDRYGLDIDPRAAVSSLTALQRAMIAIVRAIEGMRATQERGEASLLVLDEPTVFLPRSDRATLFDLARQHTAVGGSVLFVSHDLEECLEVTDRITVLRDGFLQGTVTTSGVNRAEIIRMMVGKHLDFQSHREDTPAAERKAVLEASGISGGSVDGIDLSLARGEVVGITGLLGSGFEDVPYLITGAIRDAGGTIALDGKTHPLARFQPADAVLAGLALVPGDRTRDGSVVSLSVLDNISVQSLRRYRGRLGIDWPGLGRMARDLVVQYDVRPPKVDARYGTLSGGNQQKVMLAKWLHTKPKVLVLHEPTQGVDVGAREQIFSIIRQGARNGAAVLCASADQEQLALVCDRVLIMRDGRIAAELVGDQVTKANIANETLQAKPITKDAR
jgi:ribose transport system ATP-binding protein